MVKRFLLVNGEGFDLDKSDNRIDGGRYPPFQINPNNFKIATTHNAVTQIGDVPAIINISVKKLNKAKYPIASRIVFNVSLIVLLPFIIFSHWLVILL